jgi:hypothetical protein
MIKWCTMSEPINYSICIYNFTCFINMNFVSKIILRLYIHPSFTCLSLSVVSRYIFYASCSYHVMLIYCAQGIHSLMVDNPGHSHFKMGCTVSSTWTVGRGFNWSVLFRLFTNSMIWRCGLTWFDGVCGFTPVSFAGFNIWRKLHRHRPSLLSVFHSWCPSWCSPAMLQWHPLAHHFPALAPCSQSMPAFHGRVIMDGNGRRAEHQRGWCASRLSVSQLPWATRGRLLNEQQQQTKQTACSCFCSLLNFSRDFTSFLFSKLCKPY